MERRSGSSRTQSQSEWHTRRTSQWEFTLACGTQKNGQQEVALWKQTGRRLRSLHPTGTSTMTMPAYGPLRQAPLLVNRNHQDPTMRGWTRNLTARAKNGWNGLGRITWFTITAPMLSDFLRGSLQSVGLTQLHNWLIKLKILYNI